MRQHLQLCLLAVVLFAASLTLFTRENRFPFYYHPDEAGKVAQVQTGKWNFNHPMLMLTTARIAAKATESMDNSQRVVEVGRWVSAGFAAGSVALLFALAWIMAGRFAGIVTGALLLTNHQFFELAHYFKEDTALLFGICAWLLALALYSKRPHWSTAMLVGIGAALALSGKYLGAFAPLLSLWLLPRIVGNRHRSISLAAFVGAFLVVFALVNLPLLLQTATFESSLHRELGLVVKGQAGMTRSVPHTVYLTSLRENVLFVLWPFMAAYFVACWRRRKDLTAFEWLTILFPIAYLAVLSFSPKTNDRYFLPATALFLYCVALGMEEVRRRYPARIVPALIMSMVLVQLPALVSYYRAFRIDDRAELTAWLNANLPTAVLAQDRRVMLPNSKRKDLLPYQSALKPTVMGKGIDATAGLDTLRAQGVTHAVISESDYGRFFLKSLRSQQGAKETYNKSQALYQALTTASSPLWERNRSEVIYLHPGLKVYALPVEASAHIF